MCRGTHQIGRELFWKQGLNPNVLDASLGKTLGIVGSWLTRIQFPRAEPSGGPRAPMTVNCLLGPAQPPPKRLASLDRATARFPRDGALAACWHEAAQARDTSGGTEIWPHGRNRVTCRETAESVPRVSGACGQPAHGRQPGHIRASISRWRRQRRLPDRESQRVCDPGRKHRD